MYAYALNNASGLSVDPENNEAEYITLENNEITISCKIYHPQKFKEFRLALDGEESNFIESMMRCSPWDAKGGKSGAHFYKTHDSQFVIKNISPKEIKTIVEVGPLYIDYVKESVDNNRPSCLGKIYGAFHVHIKSKEGTKFQQDFICMEDLFYGKSVSKKYDLKGKRKNGAYELLPLPFRE